jgi:hypothetical protein
MKEIIRFRAAKGYPLLILLALVLLMAAPVVSHAQTSATAASTGFGAAFGYAQTIGPLSYSQAGAIGNATANASAVTPFSFALSNVFTSGPSAAFATSIGTPFGSAAFVQLASFFGGFASGGAFAGP